MLASVYGQIHDEIELICVDDGSIDRTLAKLEGWKPLIERRGYSMIIISKENEGTASAISAGLGLITGDYVCFPDADDMLMPDYASEMVEFLEANPDAKWVRCDCFVNEYSEKRVTMIRGEFSPHMMPNDSTHLIEKLLARRSFLSVWSLMIRVSFFEECFPKMQLEVSCEGFQEWQINLPLALNAPVAVLYKPLYFYFFRGEGHRSQGLKNYINAEAYYEKFHSIANEVFTRLNASEDEITRWKQINNITLNRRKIQLAAECKETEKMADFICKQMDLIYPVIKCMPYESPSVLLLTECAIDRLIYTPEELQLKITPKIIKLRKALQERRVYLYGAGEACRGLLPVLLTSGCKPVCIWDRNANNMEAHLQGIPIMIPDFKSLTARERNEVTIIICIFHPNIVKEVTCLLNDNNINTIVPLTDVIEMLRLLRAVDIKRINEKEILL
jgi:glycosyltransferase involved in cell wall biosynthesis